MSETIHIQGMAELRAKLAQAGPRAQPALRQALHMVAEEIMVESKKQVPHDTGNLENTGTVHPVQGQGHQMSVTLSYGGPACRYALPVHEYPEHAPRSWKSGVSFRKGRKAHFLSDPVRAEASRLAHDLAVKIGRGIERAFAH